MSSFARKQAIKLYDTLTGRSFLNRLEELNRTQWLSRDELLARQRDKLHRLLEYAYQHVPYYQRVFREISFTPADFLTDPASFQKIPTISKAVISENFDSMVTKDPARQKDLILNHTGGSTGRRLTFMQDSNFRDYVTADVHRHIGWTGWKFGEPHAYLWGADYEVATQKALRTRAMDWALNRFVCNAYTLSEASMAAFVEQIRQKRPKVLFGYASALTRFAQFVKDNGFDDIKFMGMLSSAEVLHKRQREIIEPVLGSRVLDRYGTRELGGIGCECSEHTGLHISIEDVYVEVLRNEQPVSPGEEGDIVVTNLNNYAMPFIRYHIEDLGRLSQTSCPCGRGLPMMEVVSGRASDLLKTKDGRVIHAAFFTHTFFDMSEIKQFQITQKNYDHIVVALVEQEKLGAERLNFIEHHIKNMVGPDARVEIQLMDTIPPKASGKHRFIVSEVQ